MQSNHNVIYPFLCKSKFKVTSIFQRMQSNHNIIIWGIYTSSVQSYLNFSKNAIKSQHFPPLYRGVESSKLPQFFKECNQITTPRLCRHMAVLFKVTSIFQRMQSNHNIGASQPFISAVQSYLNFSKNAIKSQQANKYINNRQCSKLPQFFKECNQITTEWF